MSSESKKPKLKHTHPLDPRGILVAPQLGESDHHNDLQPADNGHLKHSPCGNRNGLTFRENRSPMPE